MNNAWNMIYPILIIVASNVIYHICAKSMPENVNSFASLSASYLVAFVCSLILFFVTSDNKNIFSELSKANWTTYVLGIVIVGLEFGVICAYKAGWKISTENLVSNISLACVLLFVGLLLYKEAITLKQVIGMVVCGAGLYLIVK